MKIIKLTFQDSTAFTIVTDTGETYKGTIHSKGMEFTIDWNHEPNIKKHDFEKLERLIYNSRPSTIKKPVVAENFDASRIAKNIALLF